MCVCVRVCLLNDGSDIVLLEASLQGVLLEAVDKLTDNEEIERDGGG